MAVPCSQRLGCAPNALSRVSSERSAETKALVKANQKPSPCATLPARQVRRGNRVHCPWLVNKSAARVFCQIKTYEEGAGRAASGAVAAWSSSCGLAAQKATKNNTEDGEHEPCPAVGKSA